MESFTLHVLVMVVSEQFEQLSFSYFFQGGVSIFGPFPSFDIPIKFHCYLMCFQFHSGSTMDTSVRTQGEGKCVLCVL